MYYFLSLSVLFHSLPIFGICVGAFLIYAGLVHKRPDVIARAQQVFLGNAVASLILFLLYERALGSALFSQHRAIDNLDYVIMGFALIAGITSLLGLLYYLRTQALPQVFIRSLLCCSLLIVATGGLKAFEAFRVSPATRTSDGHFREVDPSGTSANLPATEQPQPKQLPAL